MTKIILGFLSLSLLGLPSWGDSPELTPEKMIKCFAGPQPDGQLCMSMMKELVKQCPPSSTNPACKKLESELSNVNPKDCIKPEMKFSLACIAQTERLTSFCVNEPDSPNCAHAKTEEKPVPKVTPTPDRPKKCASPQECLLEACHGSRLPTAQKADFVRCAEHQKLLITASGAQLTPWTLVNHNGQTGEVIDAGCFNSPKPIAGTTEVQPAKHVFLVRQGDKIRVHSKSLAVQLFTDIRTAIDKGCAAPD